MEFLEIGKIVRCHGLRGLVKAVSYLESEENLQSLDQVFIERVNGQTEPLKLINIEVQIQRKTFILAIKGVDDINAAKSLIGCKLLMPIDKLQKLPEGEYYWRELMGLDVFTEDGRFLGIIREILPTGSNDVYICNGGEREILLPAIADVIKRIDTENRIMVVRLIEGL